MAVTEDGDFIFIRQYRHGTKQILLEFPAGCIEESDQDAAAAVKRELLEETGYAGDEPVFLCKVAPNASSLSNFAHCYLVTGCRRVKSRSLTPRRTLRLLCSPPRRRKSSWKRAGSSRPSMWLPCIMPNGF